MALSEFGVLRVPRAFALRVEGGVRLTQLSNSGVWAVSFKRLLNLGPSKEAGSNLGKFSAGKDPLNRLSSAAIERARSLRSIELSQAEKLTTFAAALRDVAAHEP
ncbi:hypothetical protein QTI17_34540 [Variovorax sp. J31P179]|uniref:hypothetical protein n=1 Tax=Variovorax sp. J31P179 TaxID=3053508 RepID=UPI002577CFA6|nr:hypothetical protein [Variovorax sp. J31P179]MDM0085709.1 hypothetical protein [Variovorax sp. J31P179]